MRIGFVGLGVMGLGMVPRLQAAGYKVTGWNRTKAKAQSLIDAGMGWADTPRAVAEISDVVFTVVTGGKAVKDVALGRDGIIEGLKPGGIYIDMSTIAPEVTREVADAFATVVAAHPVLADPGSPALDEATADEVQDDVVAALDDHRKAMARLDRFNVAVCGYPLVLWPIETVDP